MVCIRGGSNRGEKLFQVMPAIPIQNNYCNKWFQCENYSVKNNRSAVIVLFSIMFRQLLTGRALLALVAILIVSGTILYSSYLAKKIEKEEKQKVEQWVEATIALFNPNVADTRLPSKIIIDNNDIPIIWTNERDSIIESINLDSSEIRKNPKYVYRQLKKFKSENHPIIWTDPQNPHGVNKV